MKNIIRLTGLLALLGAPASAEWALGRGALQLEANLNAVYDSNLRASADESEDFYLSLQPILRYRRISARFNTNAMASITAKRHLEQTAANSDDLAARINWHMTRTAEDTVGARFGLAYTEASDAVLEINDRVKSRNFTAAVAGDLLLSRRHQLNAGLTYHDTRRDIASNQTSLQTRLGYSYVGFVEGTSLHLGYAHQHSESTDPLTGATRLEQTTQSVAATFSRLIYADLTGSATAGYRWLERSAGEQSAGLPDRQGSYLGIALSGPFLPRRQFPKTTGTFRIAYEQADVPGLNDSSSERLVGQVNLTWQARERTSIGIYARRAQDLSVNDNTVISTGGGLNVTQNIGIFTTADFGVGYTNAEFIELGRTDRRYEARAGVSYKINHTWSSRASYRYLNSESNATIADYQRHIVMLTLTYAF